MRKVLSGVSISDTICRSKSAIEFIASTNVLLHSTTICCERGARLRGHCPRHQGWRETRQAACLFRALIHVTIPTPLHVCFVWRLHDKSTLHPERMSLDYRSIAIAEFEVGHLSLSSVGKFGIPGQEFSGPPFLHLWIRKRSSSIPRYPVPAPRHSSSRRGSAALHLDLCWGCACSPDDWLETMQILSQGWQ